MPTDMYVLSFHEESICTSQDGQIVSMKDGLCMTLLDGDTCVLNARVHIIISLEAVFSFSQHCGWHTFHAGMQLLS